MLAQQLLQLPTTEGAWLTLSDIARPEPQDDELLLRVLTCGVCHTDLHLVQGELAAPKLPIIPGHQIVGIVEGKGAKVRRFQIGERVGVAWLHDSCGECAYCQNGQENLCEQAHFTGYTAQGGFAEYTTVPQSYAYPIPAAFSDEEAAPLLCAGVVGYRSLRLAELKQGERLGIYGFGASGHICIQVARYWGCEVYVFTRSKKHQDHARELGAAWVGQAQDTPPQKLDRAIIFAPAGWIVPLALGHLRRGGTLAINAIHMSNLPEMPYHLLWHERTIRSVANVTRADAEEFLPLAAKIGIRSTTQIFTLEEANLALSQIQSSALNGSAVLRISS